MWDGKKGRERGGIEGRKMRDGGADEDEEPRDKVMTSKVTVDRERNRRVKTGDKK